MILQYPMPLGVGRGHCQNVGLRDFCHILTLLPPGALLFLKHMSSYILLSNKFEDLLKWKN